MAARSKQYVVIIIAAEPAYIVRNKKPSGQNHISQ